MNYRLLSFVLGLHLAAIGFVLFLFSLADAFFFPEEFHHWHFLFAAAISLLLSILFTLPKLNVLDKRVTFREGFAIAIFGYLFLALMGALPFYFGINNLSLLDALFESLSALTTTGLSVFSSNVNIFHVHNVLLLWRSFEQWLGGIAVLILFLSVMPYLKISSVRLVKEKISGNKKGVVSFKLGNSIASFLSIYFFFTLMMIILLLLNKISFLNAVSLAFSTVSTGGLSIYGNSIGSIPAFSTTISYWIVGMFMYITSTSYFLHLNAMRGNPKNYWHNSKFFHFHGIIFVSLIFMTINLYPTYEPKFFTAVGKSLFAVLSAISTTGFSVQNMSAWPIFTRLAIIFLLFVGPMSGSLGGGIKLVRALALVKQAVIEIVKTVHPNKVMSPRFGKEHIPHSVLEKLNAYIVIYFFLFAVSLAAFAASNLNFEESLLMTVSAFTTGGQILFANHFQAERVHEYSAYAKLVLMYTMLLGRLEIYPLLALLQPRFWRK